MTPKPFDPEELTVLRALHAGLPQCLTCMQPQRCTIGRLLDTVAQAEAQTAAAVEALADLLVIGYVPEVPEWAKAARTVADLSAASARFIADVEKPWFEALGDLLNATDPKPTKEWQAAYDKALPLLAAHERALLATTPSAEGK